MRDYFVVAVVLASLPVGLFRPFYGLLVYVWISYMNPHQLAWSFAQSFPVAKLAALAVFGGCMLSPPRNFGILFHREMLAMICLMGTFTLSSIFGLYPTLVWIDWQIAAKLIIMALLSSLLLTERQHIRYFLLVIALSLGFYGAKGGVFSIVTGGEYRVWGPGTSIIGANNALGLALNTALPILWYLAKEEKGWIKRVLRGTFFLTIPAVMFTYSRASILTLVVVLAAIAFKSRQRYLLVPVAVIVAVVSIQFVPQVWLDRVETVNTYEQDESAMSRIDNWRFVWRLALERPLTGAGFQFFERATFERYAPEFLLQYDTAWNTHSIYFAMLGSHGFPGLTAFLGMIGLCILSCMQMKRRARRHAELRWIESYSDIILVSFLAYLINGAFNNMEYFDLPYHLVAVVVSMKTILDREVGTLQVEVTSDPRASAQVPEIALPSVGA